jgi:ribose transport system permease protein
MSQGSAKATTEGWNWARLTPVDVICLGGIAALLLGFLALPWMSEGGVDATGINLLISGSPPLSEELSSYFADTRWRLLLVPLGTIVAAVGFFLKTSERWDFRWASSLVPLGGLITFAYFVLYFLDDRDAPAQLLQHTGVGFWLACFASAILVIQRFAVKSTASMKAVSTEEGPIARLRDRIGRWMDNPRVATAVSTVFRFQPFFGLFIVIVLAIVFSPTRDGSILFLNERNLSNVSRDVSETGILAVGMLLVIIIGGIDLSVGSVVALSATGVAYLLMRDLVPSYAAVTIILAMGLLIGWWNGWVSERFRVPPFITTLAMMGIARGVAHLWSNDIAVPISYGEGGADPMFELIGQRIEGVFPVPAIIMFGAAIIMALVLRYSAFGRYLYAIGGNQVAARLSGLAVSRIKITAFMLCSFFAALAGVVHAAQLDQGSPNEGVFYELNAIAAVVIGGASLGGGRGTIAGAVAGAFILGILDNMLSLNNVNSNAQLIIKGLLVVGAVALQQMRPRLAED